MTLEILSLLPNGLQCLLKDMRASVRLPSVLWGWDSMNCTTGWWAEGGRTIFLPGCESPVGCLDPSHKWSCITVDSSPA